jgi:hypothetical protein
VLLLLLLLLLLPLLLLPLLLSLLKHGERFGACVFVRGAPRAVFHLTSLRTAFSATWRHRTTCCAALRIVAPAAFNAKRCALHCVLSQTLRAARRAR